MNERFRELAQLAVADAAKYCQRPFDLSREENETFALSFAEMIVRECANRASWAQDTGEEDIGGEVLKHFGVEE